MGLKVKGEVVAMPRWCLVTACFFCLAAVVLFLRSRPSDPSLEVGPPPSEKSQNISASDPAANTGQPTDPWLPKLPETSPPHGLPIIAWGHRDLFPVIRKPAYVDAATGDTLLLETEPVLGVVVGDEARAYSTNQLNRHEMVIDEIAGVSVLVTY